MADPRAAWLALQSELGGDEIIFDEPVDNINRAKHAATPVVGEPIAEKPSPIKERRVKQYEKGKEPSWLVDAPPIPEDGLTINTDSAATDGTSQFRALDELAESVKSCTKCPLCEGRTLAVPGEGNPSARLMVIGEGPGAQEDESGRPFVGRAGDTLNKMLEAIECPRESVFIANVVKCRPPKNRAPLPDERASCLPYLHQQLKLVKPKVILALGGTASEAILGVRGPLGSVRMKVHYLDSVPLVVTYHPAALLRNKNWKRPAWDDIRIARQLLDLDE